MRERNNQTPWGTNSSSWARGWTTTAERTWNLMCVSNSNKFHAWRWVTMARTRNFIAWVLNNSWREEEKSVWVKSAFFLSIQKSTMGGVCVEAWTDNPATPLPKQLTAITSLSYQQKLLTKGGWDKTKWEDTWIFNPLAKAGQFPHPYPCENHAPFDLVAVSVAGRIHLIMMHIYMMENIIYAACPNIQSVTN